MLATFITFPTDFATSTLNIAGIMVSDLSPVLLITVGVTLGVVVVAILISILTHHK